MNFPISVDDGPAIDGYSNLLQFSVSENWETFLENGYNYNWNIKAFFERDGVQYESYYGVYRTIDGSEPELVGETMEEEYTDPVGAGTGTFCYKVKALYYNGCESEYSPESCLLITEVPFIDEEGAGTVKIYPNPASDILYIESAEKIKRVSVIDFKGETVEQWNLGTLEPWNNGTLEQPNERSGEQAMDHLVVVPVESMAPGLYLVRVELGNGVVGRKVVVR